MMRAWLLMVSLAAGDLSQAAQAALRPLTDAIREARSKQAALPPDAAPKEQLEAVLALDQHPLIAMHHVDLSGLSPEDRTAARAEADAQL